mmetsp:Transcript_60225/g.132389  ORF Transcript_60225/g.132389 Transcript_60225/m.132389 type:complete len:172 (-) Transcript_60225:121-636(-)
MGPKKDGTHVWWGGPQDVGKKRELAELDPYQMFDRNQSASRKCVDTRWRQINVLDSTRKAQFGPSPKDIERGGARAQLREARPEMTSSPLSFKLDPYGARLGNTFTVGDHSRRFVFPPPRNDRFVSTRMFAKDFTHAGCKTNKIVTVIGSTGGHSMQRTQSAPSTPMATTL